MPRPKANPMQHIRAHQLFSQGQGQLAIFEALEREFGDKAVSERTVGNWIRGFKADSGNRINLDVPFEWLRLEEYGLPWESSEFLLDTWAFALEERNRLMSATDRPLNDRPTMRDARWWLRVHYAAPDLSLPQVLQLSRAFAFREIANEILGWSLEFKGLQAYLSYKSWVSPEHMTRYDQAIERGEITSWNDMESEEGEIFLLQLLHEEGQLDGVAV